MDSERLMELVRQLMDADPRRREMGAEKVTDWVNSYSSTEGRMLATLLSICASNEGDHGALESQLHALIELGSSGSVDVDSIYHLREIDRSSIPSTLSEYVNDLLEE